MPTESLRAIDICAENTVTADEHTSVYDVTKLMREHHIGDVVITRSVNDAAVPIGVLTDRDIVVHGIACNVSLDEVTAGDLSAHELVRVEPDADLFEIVATMNNNGVRRIVVTHDNELDGIISLDDILWALSMLMSHLGAVPERQIRRETDTEI